MAKLICQVPITSPRNQVGELHILQTVSTPITHLPTWMILQLKAGGRAGAGMIPDSVAAAAATKNNGKRELIW